MFASQVYPTNVRARGLGLCSSWARVGAILTPIVAQVVLKVNVFASLLFYATSGFVAALCSRLLPIETVGRQTLDTVYDAASN